MNLLSSLYIWYVILFLFLFILSLLTRIRMTPSAKSSRHFPRNVPSRSTFHSGKTSCYLLFFHIILCFVFAADHHPNPSSTYCNHHRLLLVILPTYIACHLLIRRRWDGISTINRRVSERRELYMRSGFVLSFD